MAVRTFARPRCLVFASLAAAVLLSTPAFVGPGSFRSAEARQTSRAVARSAERESDKMGRAIEQSEGVSPLRLGGVALSLFAALVMALVPVSEAQAAISGGRIGSSAPAKKAPPAPASKTTTINKTTIVNKTVVVPPPPPPVVAAPPPMVAPVGMGMGVVAPVVVAPPPTLGDVIVGTVVGNAVSNAITGGNHSGPSTTDRILENQQRQDERQLDRQAAQIELLQAEIQSMKAASK